MLLDADDAQLVLVDYQTRLMPAIFEADDVMANANRLALIAKAMNVPIWGTTQSVNKLGPLVPALQTTLAEAGARVLDKMHFSAMADGLGDWLRPPVRKAAQGGNARSLPKHLQKPAQPEEEARGPIVIAGCEAHVCLLQTALDLLEDEFDVWVVTDACGSRSQRSRDAAFDRLAGNGAELVTTEMVAFEWLRSADHPLFRSIQGLIK
jgi:nicotinamidase-related amidase